MKRLMGLRICTKLFRGSFFRFVQRETSPLTHIGRRFIINNGVNEDGGIITEPVNFEKGFMYETDERNDTNANANGNYEFTGYSSGNLVFTKTN